MEFLVNEESRSRRRQYTLSPAGGLEGLTLYCWPHPAAGRGTTVPSVLTEKAWPIYQSRRLQRHLRA